jgi:large subunit ribosomal protein L46
MSLIIGTDSQLIPEQDPTVDEILESMPFQPASRTTEADIQNDRKSTERCLDKSLYLIVKRNRETNSWQFPQGKWNEGETMRQTGERVGDRAVGKVNRWYISNAPIGHICYAYPPSIQQQRKQYGAKVFYYRCQLIAGNVKLETKLYKDFAWVTRDEMGEYVNEETAALLSELLPF